MILTTSYAEKLEYYLSLVTMKNARWFINIYHVKANYKSSHIKEGCEDNRVNRNA